MERRMDRRERERERSRQSSSNDRVDLDSRTPLAWQHRDFNYQHSANSQSNFHERYPEGVPSSSSDRFSHPSLGSRSARSAAAAMEDGRQGGGGGGQQQQAGKKRMMRDHAGATSARGPATGGGAHKKASTSSSTGTSNHTGMAAASSSSAAEGGGGGPGGANRNSSSARPSRSSQETTTGSSSETETDAERMQPSRPGTSGTLRSMQSMPLLTPLQQHHLVQQQQQAGYNPVLAAAGGIYGVVGMHPGMMPHPAQLHAAAAAAAAAGNPTWNGEPCPVHGSGIHPAHHQMPIAHYQTPHGTIAAYPQPLYSSMSMKRAASIHEMAMATPLPAIMPPPPPPHHGPIYGTLPHPGHGGGHHQFLIPPPPSHEQPTHFVMMTTAPSSMIHGPPASSLGGRRTRQQGRSGGGPGSLPPMPAPSQMATMQRQGRPLVVNGKNGQPEPLPVRHDAPPLPPKIPPSDVASKTASRTSSAAKPFSYNACCKGNVVVLWVILGIIGLGVVLAIVFYYAFQ